MAWHYRALLEAYKARDLGGDASDLLGELRVAVEELERVAHGVAGREALGAADS